MIVAGYHGTSSEAAERIMTEGFQLIRNPYDWLGDGIYFFQDAPQRAWNWARERHGNYGAVVGADILLEHCVDLLDVGWYQVMAAAYDSYVQNLRDSGQPVPLQSGGAHRLDREVMNYMTGVLRESGLRVTCVRAAFGEGHPVYPDSAFYDHAHVQIAVRDIEACIQHQWLESAPALGR